ncbi:hypothetical protein GQ457_12G007070 [Hibiscus cannabinus]
MPLEQEKEPERFGLWPDVTPAITDVVASPTRLSTVQPRLKNKEVHGWTAPERGSVNFNTDGAVEGSYGEAGVGGCLRDENSKTLLYFSLSAGVNNVVSKEILALKEAIRQYNSVTGRHSNIVVFECDIKLVVVWLQHPHLAPVNIKEEIVGCINECKDLDCRFQPGQNWVSTAAPLCSLSCNDNRAKTKGGPVLSGMAQLLLKQDLNWVDLLISDDEARSE